MVWEAIFLLLVLKIPCVYLAAVVWWAIRAEPRPPEAPAALVPVADTPAPPGVGPRWSARNDVRRRARPPRTPRRPAGRRRVASVRAEVRR